MAGATKSCTITCAAWNIRAVSACSTATRTTDASGTTTGATSGSSARTTRSSRSTSSFTHFYPERSMHVFRSQWPVNQLLEAGSWKLATTSEGSRMSRVLVIDDDPGVRESMSRMLSQAGYTVRVAETGEEGFDIARAGGFDVILSDMRMPGLSGLDVLRKLRDVKVDASFIVMTGFGTVDSAVEAMKLGAVDFVQKPFFRDELLMRVRSAADRRQLARQVELLERHMQPAGSLDALVGQSPAMLRAKDLIARAAAAGGTVLITGETGTGKELAARAIHASSSRAGRPFVALNCAALTESLLENELFGHARGAFTGAGTAREGLIEHASGGTLFLDEIGTMT